MSRRWWLAIALVPASLLLGGAMTPTQEAQKQLNSLLHGTAREEIARRRTACATGEGAEAQRDLREAGFKTAPAGAWCVTILTRAGRDGTLGYVRDPNGAQLSPSFAFDTGFVSGYRKREALPAGAPPIAALLPVAERCLYQQEPNTRLCTATGYMLGLRASHGEVVTLR